MNVKDFESVFTHKQLETIADNLRAYLANFSYLKIAKADYGKGFYVFADESRPESYTQYCYSLDYLNGWLYGAVQAVNGIMQPKIKEA